MYDCKYIGKILQQASPQATASITGSKKAKNLRGRVAFYDIGNAVLVSTSLSGIPYRNGYCQYPVLGLHIHQGRPHPNHAGDLPPVFVNEGMAWSAVILTKFTIKEILGRVVILHSMPDDFHSQPSGNSGEKIACGIIPRNSPKTLD